MICHKNNLLNR